MKVCTVGPLLSTPVGSPRLDHHAWIGGREGIPEPRSRRGPLGTTPGRSGSGQPLMLQQAIRLPPSTHNFRYVPEDSSSQMKVA